MGNSFEEGLKNIRRMLGLDRPKKVNTKLFTIVRGDLPPGYQLAQTLHAGIELIYSISNFRYIKDWKE
jgi:hypothetical protein